MLDKIMVGVIVLVLVVIIGSIIFHVCDYTGVPSYNITAQVMDKDYTPQRTEIRNVQIGNSLIPQSHTTPASYRLYVFSDKGSGYCTVSERFYKNAKVNDSIDIEYCIGRFSGSIMFQQ